MFIDENVVTLDSPEISNEAFNFDNADYKFRIIGAAKFDSVISDYDINASHGYLAGTNKFETEHSATIGEKNIDGIISDALWVEQGLKEKSADDEKIDIKKRTQDNYEYGGAAVRYWLHMWNRSGHIDGFESEDGNYSVLNTKHFANLRFSYGTYYSHSENDSVVDFGNVDSLRQYNYLSSQFAELNIGSGNYLKKRYYNGIVQMSLGMPGEHKYPILYSDDFSLNEVDSSSEFLFSDAPVLIEYASNPHAVIALPSSDDGEYYNQTILPRINSSSNRPDITIPERFESTQITGAILPWYDQIEANDKVVRLPVDYRDISFDGINEEQKYITLTRVFNSDSEDFWDKYVWVLKNIKDYKTEDTLYVKFSIQLSKKVLVNIDSVSAVKRQVSSGSVIQIEIKYSSLILDSEESETINCILYDGYIRTLFGKEYLALIRHSEICNYNITDDSYSVINYPFIDYKVNQSNINIDKVKDTDKYLFIGEIYRDADVNRDYGGIDSSDIQNNRFIPASPVYSIDGMMSDGTQLYPKYIYGNQGDTYFQRWDDVKTKPYSSDAVNQVTDIASFMVETHINLDGRTDLQRGITQLAHLDLEKFGSINPVYSQDDNYFVSRDLNEDFDIDTYRSSITWTLPKADSALIDEWSHITLASSLKLDGDKGNINALRRFQNSIIAFQDRGIAEVLFNSRTQLSTTDGVPIEIANSGKVDGKRYISNKYGCINKWSIVEGKAGLYFIDDTNKAFCSFTGDGIKNLSSDNGFNVVFRRANKTYAWSPATNDAIISFYDRIHSDVYLLGAFEEAPCLVYNERLGMFTSFFSYENVPMMTNIGNRFVAYRNNRLWGMNEGNYLEFFTDGYKPFGVTYRVTPNPYTDKIWSTVEYRSDVFDMTQTDDEESNLIDGIHEDGKYQADETFDNIYVRNEYQHNDTDKAPRLQKKFRIWRYEIPRAVKGENSNKFGLDRFRSPWIVFKFERNGSANRKEQLNVIHDFIAYYFE